PSDDIATTVKAVTAEIVRAAKFGFNENELERVKKNMLSMVEKLYKERSTTESSRLIGEYIRNFLDNEPIPGIENEYAYYQKMIPTITLDEVNKTAKDWLDYKNQNYFALVTGPDSKQMEVPTNQELLSAVENGFKQEVTAKEEVEVAATLLEKEPIAGKIVSEKADKDL